MNILSEDCREWPPCITDDLQQFLIKSGPIKISNTKFPSGAKGRNFSQVNYNSKRRNGEEVRREWLIHHQKIVYSVFVANFSAKL